MLPKQKTALPHWRRPFEEPKIRAQFTRRRLQCSALLRPRSRDSGQALAHAKFGERRTLIGFLPEATHLGGPTRRFHLLSIGAQGPTNLSVLADPAGLLHRWHVGKSREVTDENRHLRPKQQVVCTCESRLPSSRGPRKTAARLVTGGSLPRRPLTHTILPFLTVLRPNSVIRR